MKRLYTKLKGVQVGNKIVPMKVVWREEDELMPESIDECGRTLVRFDEVELKEEICQK